MLSETDDKEEVEMLKEEKIDENIIKYMLDVCCAPPVCEDFFRQS